MKICILFIYSVNDDCDKMLKIQQKIILDL